MATRSTSGSAEAASWLDRSITGSAGSHCSGGLNGGQAVSLCVTMALFVLHFRGWGGRKSGQRSSNPVLPISSLSLRRYLIQSDFLGGSNGVHSGENGRIRASCSRIPTSRKRILGIKSRSLLFGVRLRNHGTLPHR